MVIELEKDDLVNLITTQTPQEYDRLKFNQCGYGKWSFYHSKWEWKLEKLFSLSEEELLDLYSYLRGRVYVFLKE